jgi:cytochrome c-type biogenesis protein
VVVVNYFATWCGPCREEFPDLEKIARDYKERGVDVVGVGLDTDDESPAGALGVLRAFAEEEKPGFPILLPMKGQATGEMIPYTYLIDKRGRVGYYIVGRMEVGHVRELVEKLLAE